MIKGILDICRDNPEILIFLTLAVGYMVGKIKFFGFNVGSTTGVLIASLVIGQIDVSIPPLVKTIAFALFTFGIGYKVGPQFFGALKKEGLKYIWISLVVAVTALIVAIFLGKILHFDKGTAAGFFAGSVTQSAAVGTAEGAIDHLPITEDEKSKLDTNVAVAYAITYLFGTGGVIVLLKMMPGFWKINLKDEAKKLEHTMSGGTEDIEKTPGLFSWSRQLNFRAYRVSNRNISGKKVSEVEALFPVRISIDKLKRNNRIIALDENTVIQTGDIVAFMGRREAFIKASDIIGPEVDDKDVTDIVGEMLDICVLSPKVAGRTLGELGNTKEAHGIFLRKATRQGHELPITRDTVVNKCDIFQVIGVKDDIEKLIKYVGYPERPTSVTDIITLGLGCVFGTLLGLIAVPVFGIPITLGVGGGVLVGGLICGWLRTIHPTFGQIPSGAQRLLTDLGLNLFIACLGLGAATQALKSLETTGVPVFLAGTVLAIVPVLAGLYFGKHVLKMNPVLLLGAVAGARVLTAALNMLQEESESTMPLLGYAAPYAFGNVLLIIWGSVIVNVM